MPVFDARSVLAVPQVNTADSWFGSHVVAVLAGSPTKMVVPRAYRVIHVDTGGHLYKVPELVVACQRLLGIKRCSAQRAHWVPGLHMGKAVQTSIVACRQQPSVSRCKVQKVEWKQISTETGQGPAANQTLTAYSHTPIKQDAARLIQL